MSHDRFITRCLTLLYSISPSTKTCEAQTVYKSSVSFFSSPSEENIFFSDLSLGSASAESSWSCWGASILPKDTSAGRMLAATGSSIETDVTFSSPLQTETFWQASFTEVKLLVCVSRVGCVGVFVSTTVLLQVCVRDCSRFFFFPLREPQVSTFFACSHLELSSS